VLKELVFKLKEKMTAKTNLRKCFENKQNVLAGFTSRWGGVGIAPFDNFNLASYVGDNDDDVFKNRELLTKELGIDIANLAWMNQIHLDSIKTVSGGGEVLNSDGLITKRQDLALLVLVADCIPILFYDPVQKVIAVAYAGREGSFKNISGKMILKMQEEFHSVPEDVLVSLGPSIKKCCYKVNKSLIKKFENRWGSECIYNSINLDLPLLNKNQLLEKGILEKNIKISDTCTYCNNNYFSYRRQQKTGRFAGVITLKI
jgi:YfiH family protein